MLKVIAKTALLIASILIIALSVIVIRPDWFTGPVQWAVQAATGLQLRIGSIDTRLAPARLDIADLHLGNPQWPTPELLSVGRLSLQLIASPFARGPFWRLDGSDIDVLIARNSRGESNWGAESTSPPPAAEDGQPTARLPLPSDFSFDTVRLENTAVHWRGPDRKRDIGVVMLAVERTGDGTARARLEFDIDGEPFTATARTSLPREPRAGMDYVVELNHSRLTASSEGNLMPELAGSQLRLQANVRSLADFGPLLGMPLPAFETFDLGTQVLIAEHYELRDFHLSIGTNRIAGQLWIDPQARKAGADLKTEGIHLLPIIAALPTDAEEPAETEEQALHWSALRAWSGQVELALAEFHAGEWSAADMRLVASSDKNLRLSMQAGHITHSTMNFDFPDVNIDAVLQPLAEKTMGADIDIELDAALGDNVTAKVAGRANINGLPGSSLTLAADGSSAALWKALALPYRDAGKLALSGKLETREDGIDQQLNAKLGEQTLQSQLQYRAGDTPYAKLDVTGRGLDLRFMRSDEEPEAEPKPPSKTLFSEEPIDFGALQSLDADIRLRIEDTHTGYSRLASLDVSPTLKNGVLNIDHGTASVEGGKAVFDLRVDSGASPPGFSTELQIDGDDFGAMGLAELAQMQGGRGIVDVKLTGSGASSRALAASLNGRADIQIEDLTANNTRLDLLGSDLINETFRTLNPFAKEEKHTRFRCIAVHFDAKDGRLESDKNVILETDKMKIVGTGHVDFNDETLSLSFTPIARKGFGVNLGNVVQLVRVGGTLNNPRLVADAGGVMTGTLSAGAAVYTGGLSLLAENLIQRAVNTGSACDPDAEPEEYDLPVLPSAVGEQPAGAASPDDTGSLQSPDKSAE